MKKATVSAIIVTILAMIAAITGATININIEQDKYNATIEYSEEAQPAMVEDDLGEIVEEEAIPTVEEVDGGKIIDECPEGEEECGLGRYIYAPTETFKAFKDYTLNKCWNVDGYAGSQCWDLGALFWMNYTKDGRTLSTCGTGAAKYIWNCKEYNAGTEFDLIYNASDIKTGDWVIFSSGTYGHIGEAAGPYNNGYVALLGQNQGSYACEGGGSATNIINISLKSFVGAFRPKTYIPPKPEPQPTPKPEDNKVVYTVKKGDTLGALIRQAGYKGNKLFGNTGLAQKVAEENGIKNRGLIYPGHTIVIDQSLFASF